jgi:hypothetical protein
VDDNQMFGITDGEKFEQRYGGLKNILGKKLEEQAKKPNNQLELDLPGKRIEQL